MDYLHLLEMREDPERKRAFLRQLYMELWEAAYGRALGGVVGVESIRKMRHILQKYTSIGMLREVEVGVSYPEGGVTVTVCFPNEEGKHIARF